MDEHLASLLGIDMSDPATLRSAKDTEALANLIESLVRHRKACRITQKEVAQAMETTQSAVSEFERLGGDPRLSTIMRYARAVGMEIYVAAHTERAPVHPSSDWTTVAETEERVPSARARRKAS